MKIAGTVSLQELRKLGWALWDPLGLGGIAPDDEYDSYLMGLVGQLRQGATDGEATAYLAKLEADWMGLIPSASVEAAPPIVGAMRNYLKQFPPGPLKFR
jgi:hypothetical protein